jgi:hypothetical protein
MSDNVFILGAGASKLAGAPLMADFLDVATDLYRSKRVDGKAARFEKVFHAIGELQAVHSKAQLDLNNIESIFTALELGRIIRHMPGMHIDELEDVIDALKELIVTTIQQTMMFPVQHGEIGVPRPYNAFAELLVHIQSQAATPQSVSVITFNYDIGCDIALHRRSLGPHYGLNEKKENPQAVDLLKLHGSLNWATEKETPQIVPLHLSDYLRRYRINVFGSQSIPVPIGTQLKEYFSKHHDAEIEVNDEPLLIPPSWNKGDYHRAISNVWSKAAQHLSEALNIFIIGYSLPETDSFFRHLYALGSVGNAPLRRIEVFNPDSTGEVDRRFRSLLGPGAEARYLYHTKLFVHAISQIKAYFPSRT